MGPENRSPGATPTRVRDAKEGLVDEALLESFPASDPPAWTGMHAGAPSPVVPCEMPHPAMRETLRADASGLPRDRRRAADYVATALAGEGWAVLRSPTSERESETLEIVLGGTAPGDELVIGARYDEDPAAVAVLLGIARLLRGRHFRNGVRLVAYAGGGSREYVRSLRERSVTLIGALALHRLSVQRRHRRSLLSSVVRSALSRAGAGRGGISFLGDRASRGYANTVSEAFSATSRLGHAPHGLLVTPLLVSPDHRAFVRGGFRAATVTLESANGDAHDSDAHDSDAHDWDGLTDLVFGLVAVAAKMCGGEMRASP